MDKKQFQGIQQDAYRSYHSATADLDLQICELSSRGKTATQIAMEIPCSESTVYRALRRVQDFISVQNYDRFLQMLRQEIDQHPSSFDGNAQSALEMLYTAYAENNEHETAECDTDFLALDAILSDFPLALSNSIFEKVCALCSIHERNGFTEGFKLGIHMAHELNA